MEMLKIPWWEAAFGRYTKPQSKKKAAAKKTAMQKKKSQAMDDSPHSIVGAEKRANKHRSYIKLQEDGDSGGSVVSCVEG